MRRTERLVVVALLSALALAAGLAESHFPLPFPGMRLGIANVFSLLALLLFGPVAAVTVAAVKLFLSFFLSGNLVALACSFGGLLCSLPATIGLYRAFPGVLSVPAISVASAFAFNFGQVAAVALLTGEPAVLAYLPLLLSLAALTGFAVGVLADRLGGRLGNVLNGPDYPDYPEYPGRGRL